MQQGVWQKVKRSLTLHVILCVITALAIYSAAHMIGDTIALRKEAQDMESKRDRLLLKKAELESYRAELQTTEAIEREAKARFNLKKPGEQVVVVVPQKTSESVSSTTPSVWDRVKKFLGF